MTRVSGCSTGTGRGSSLNGFLCRLLGWFLCWTCSQGGAQPFLALHSGKGQPHFEVELHSIQWLADGVGLEGTIFTCRHLTERNFNALTVAVLARIDPCRVQLFFKGFGKRESAKPPEAVIRRRPNLVWFSYT